MARELKPEVRDLLDDFEARNLPPTYALSVEAARQRLEELFATDDPTPVGEVSDLTLGTPVGDIPARIYRPETPGPHPAVVYFHGGGWTVGSLDTHDGTARELTNRVDCAVVSIDYRLAPEHPFPAAAVDAYAATRWVADYGEKLGLDPEQIAVAGDSAGGNLAAVVSLMARDRGGPALAHQGLIYPAVSSPEIRWFESYDENATGYFLEQRSMEWFYEQYIDRPTDHRNEYAFPLLARDLSALPDATVITCEFDPLRDEGIQYANRLETAGVDVRHEHFDGMIHGFIGLKEFLDAGYEGIDVVAAGLTQAFN